MIKMIKPTQAQPTPNPPLSSPVFSPTLFSSIHPHPRSFSIRPFSLPLILNLPPTLSHPSNPPTHKAINSATIDPKGHTLSLQTRSSCAPFLYLYFPYNLILIWVFLPNHTPVSVEYIRVCFIFA